MLIADRPLAKTRTMMEGGRSTFTRFLSWFIAIVLVFLVPLAIVLGPVFVTSWGIPLPFVVRIP